MLTCETTRRYRLAVEVCTLATDGGKQLVAYRIEDDANLCLFRV